MKAMGLFDLIGQGNIFATEAQAIYDISKRTGPDASKGMSCALPSKENEVFLDSERYEN